MVRSVRSMAWTLDAERPTEGSHMTFLQFEDGAAASLVFSGYDFFDSDEFHSWVGESGEEKVSDGHGRARAALANVKAGGHDAEAAWKNAAAYGRTVRLGPGAGEAQNAHHLHCGVTIASCAFGDLRASADGVLVYDRQGRREISVPRIPVFPDKSGVMDELVAAVLHGKAPLHDGRWGKATMEVAAAVLTSARERREITLKHQVPVRD